MSDGFKVGECDGISPEEASLFERLVHKNDDKKYRVSANGGPFSSTATFVRKVGGLTITVIAQYYLESGMTSVYVKEGRKTLYLADHRFQRFPKKGESGLSLKIHKHKSGDWEDVV